MVEYKLPSLHRGHWIYQSPRIVIILAYARIRGIKDVGNMIKKHLEFINRISVSHEKAWIVSRVESLGYERQRPWAKKVDELLDPKLINYYLSKLCLTEIMEDVKELINVLEEGLRIDINEKALPYLPPTLLLPEKVVLLKAISRSESFDLKTSLEVVLNSWLLNKSPLSLLKGEINNKRKQFRFRYTYLISLNLIAGSRGSPRPTSLGLIVHGSVIRSVEPHVNYIRYLLSTNRFVDALLLDVLSMDITTKKLLDKYVGGVVKFLSDIIEDSDELRSSTYKLSESIAFLPFDRSESIAIHVMKNIENILKIIES